MKKNHLFIALIACGAMLVSSCHHHHRPYIGGSVSIGYNSGYADAWVSASYDSAGFPIYGYSYGRPVYGYTADGLAVFSFAALTASCFVPLWKPAPWYCGHWHYPRHIHRVAKPHRCPSGHHPGRRPSGGLHAPIHKNPHSVLHKHRGPNKGAHNAFKPGKPAFNRPNNVFKPGKPAVNRPNNAFKPGKPAVNRPNNAFKPGKPAIKPQTSFKPIKANVVKPSANIKPIKLNNARPAMGSMKRASAPARLSPARSSSSRPAAGMRSHSPRPAVSGGHRGGRGGKR